ncbi:MAG: galactose-1-phosphate uridylyltransferase [Candidatus Muiribacteriota bacterium]
MRDYRKDPITRRWVIISSDRSKRPRDFGHVTDITDDKNCPFCEGNEDMTPPEIFALRENGEENGPGWKARVIPDKYSILENRGDVKKKGHGIYDSMSATGFHELIIETPNHMGSLANLSFDEIKTYLKVLKTRMGELKNDYRIQYILAVKNYGSEAGAKFKHSHSHSHIVGLPIVPKRVKEEIDGAKEYYSFRERCVFCDIAAQELAENERIILNNEDFISLCTYAARFPYETHIYPKKHISSFEDTPEEMFDNLARILKKTILSLCKVIDTLAYNIVIHTKPVNQVVPVLYHWHIEIMPRVTKVAGFEWGSGFYINSVLPEDAAKLMKEKINEGV